MFDLNLNNCDGRSVESRSSNDDTCSSALVTRDLFPVQVQARKGRRGPRSRSSQYRGVTFYRRTGRWESHIWSFSCLHIFIIIPHSIHHFPFCSSHLLSHSISGTAGNKFIWVRFLLDYFIFSSNFGIIVE